MPTRIYINQSATNVRDYRSGSVGNGPTSNNYYYREFARSSMENMVVHDGWVGFTPPTPRDYNRLYNKFLDAVSGQQGELLTAGVEWKQSLDMVTKRTLWLIDSYKSFRRFDLPAVVRKLRQPVAKPPFRRTFRDNERGFKTFSKKSKKVTANTGTVTEMWLEYWMGWAPAMGDIYNALDVLSREFPNQHVSAATGYRTYDSIIYKSSTQVGSRAIKRDGVVGCYADAQITNYNLHLANQMGLVNPLKTGFQIIPFSFVLNWFVNVEQVLGALTDFAGVSLRNTGIGIMQAREGSHKVSYYRSEWEGPIQVAKWRTQVGVYHGSSKQRLPGILPQVSLVTKFDRLALTRAATAVSLLREIFLRTRD